MIKPFFRRVVRLFYTDPFEDILTGFHAARLVKELNAASSENLIIGQYSYREPVVYLRQEDRRYCGADLLREEEKMEGLAIGRIVHYVLDDQGTVRPAIIVRIWDQETGNCNLQVFTDGTNDQTGSSLVWRTSILYSEEPKAGTWHWPPKV